MDAPQAVDLFLAIWSNALSSDDDGDRMVKPGNAGFEKTRAYWARVWMDCVELSKFIAEGSRLAQDASRVTEEPRSWPPKIEMEWLDR